MLKGYRVKTELMDGKAIRRALKRLALKIVERNGGLEDVCLVGVYTRGVDLARRLQRILEEEEDLRVPLGTIDIALYRDDAMLGLPEPQIGPTSLPQGVTGKIVVLVDDVLFTGRTTRAALDALMDFGRPKEVQLLVLVDRGHRELPIQADYVGKRCETLAVESVRVRLSEVDKVADMVVLLEPDG
jgi:pyrimidine operon attenuation protein / uracil phosphoribosyltransferase